MASSIPSASGRTFLSYRQEGTAYSVGWLYGRLADRCGGGQVLKDAGPMQLGDDFVEVIARVVGCCDMLLVLLVLIDQWLTITNKHGRCRVDDPDDSCGWRLRRP